MIIQENIAVRFGERPALDENFVYGTAIVFDKPSENLMEFREVIRKGAVTEDTLKRSDVYALVNHDKDYTMARSYRMGDNSSLKLELTENGLDFSFEIPKTEKGNELREHIRRGEITQCSFAYVTRNDNVHYEEVDGVTYRYVDKIDYLLDVSPVYFPAYESTSCSLRSGDFVKYVNELYLRDGEQEEEKVDENKEEKTEEVEKSEEENNYNKENDSSNDNPSDVDDNSSNQRDCEGEPQAEQVEEEEEREGDNVEEVEEEENNNVEEKDNEVSDNNNDNKEKRNSNITMKQEFKLVDAVRSVVENKALTGASEAVNRAGQKAMQESGLTSSGQITIPMAIREGEVTYASEAEDLVEVKVFDIMAALKPKLIASKLGARIISGLNSDVVIPIGGKGTAKWTDEVDACDTAGVTFNSVKLTAKRISTYIDVSKKLLLTGNNDIESYLREELVNSIAQCLESTIFSDAAATTKSPAGMLYGVTPTEISDFQGLTDLEATLDDANVEDTRKYAVSNKAKSALRNMVKGSSLALVYENNEVDGTPALASSNLGSDKLVIVGDWKNLIIGQFGSLELIVDNLTQATRGCVRIVANMYIDFAIARDEAFAFGEIVEGD